MTEILPGIHQVDGVDPSPDFSTHVYLVKDKGDSWMLLDTGLPGTAPKIDAYLKQLKISPSSIRSIFITHLHRDHVGSLKEMIAKTHAKTYSHWIEAAYIAMDPPYDGPGTPPAEPIGIDEKFKDGDRFDVAGGMVAYHTPGHTPGHTSFYLPERKILFAGDLFFGGAPNEISLTPKEYTLHVPTAQVSAQHIANLAIISLLPYHAGPYLTDGTAKVKALLKKLHDSARNRD
jgi:glyoxylase-like metal-dependent hydrolase (beta-lactamase superfamily II)